MDIIKVNEWNKSYENHDNFIFYPHEEIIRFISKYFRKRIDINSFTNSSSQLTGLDFGCGIGRHVFFMDDYKINPYGIDVSFVAINKAQEWASILGKQHLINNLIKVNGDSNLPFANEFFDLVLSHGVFDSMPFKIAKDNLNEINRIIKIGGFCYMDLISGDDNVHYREYCGEEIVNTKHEENTIQSYFNFSKIIEIINGTSFIIDELILIRREKVLKNNEINSRYHLVLRKVK